MATFVNILDFSLHFEQGLKQDAKVIWQRLHQMTLHTLHAPPT